MGARPGRETANTLIRQSLNCLFAASMSMASPLRAADVDAGHPFGFTDGTDVGARGDRDLELGLAGRFGKRTGIYHAFDLTAQGSFTIADGVSIAPGATFSVHRIAGVPDLDDRSSTGFGGAHLEVKYRALDRSRHPFGLTFGATPFWNRIDSLTGKPVTSYGTELLTAMDRALVSERMFAAMNVRYTPGETRVAGSRQRGSELQLSAAMALNVIPDVWIGFEGRYRRAYEGLTPDHFAGDALYLGPALNIQPSDDTWFAVAWNTQVAGGAAGVPGPLDLTNFERQDWRVVFGRAF